LSPCTERQTVHSFLISGLQIALQKGEWVLWNDRPHRFESLAGDRARIREAGSARIIEVGVSELRGLPALSLDEAERDERLEHRRQSSDEAWSDAERREQIIRCAISGDGPVFERLKAAAESLGVSTRTVQRLLARYRASAQTTSLLPQPPGPRKVGRRLGAERERLIQEAIEKRYLVRPKTPMEEVYREVVRRCRLKHLPPPARGSVIRRIRALDARLVARRRMGARAAQSIALSTPGTLEVTHALELLQIDHTLADVMIVDSRHRRSIGRPWLTLAIDVATRCVLGFHVSLAAPSALSVALCIEHAVLPKKPPAGAADIAWEAFGLPRSIHVDNGREFHSEALRRGSSEYGIALTYRPVATPRFGAHIERLIGTLMGRVHLLPGSTDASPSRRAGYRSEQEAKLTLREFIDWLSLEIAGPYHHGVHRMLGTTPAAAWKASLADGVIPILPSDPKRFVIGFLPVTHRKLQRNGLFFERIRYWADVLPAIAQPRESLIVRYDPRDLSKLHVLGPQGHYHAIPYADIRRPPISLAELRYAHRLLRLQGRASINEEQLFAVHERQKEILATAAKATRVARRHHESHQSSAAATEPVSVSAIDFSKDPTPLPSEIWESSL
jgi:putative transposase